MFQIDQAHVSGLRSAASPKVLLPQGSFTTSICMSRLCTRDGAPLWPVPKGASVARFETQDYVSLQCSVQNIGDDKGNQWDTDKGITAQ